MAGLLTPAEKRGTGGPANTSDADVDNQRNVDLEANVTAEEQEQYDRFVTNGMKMLYDEKAVQKLLTSMEGDGNPVEGLANALVQVVMRLEDSSEQAGEKISPDVLLHGGTELLEQMVDLSEQAGGHKFKEKEIESALYLALDTYRTTRQQQGRLDEDALGADMEQLVQADYKGELDSLIPGIGEYAKGLPKAEAK